MGMVIILAFASQTWLMLNSMSKSISELDCMTKCPSPPIDLKRANRLAIVAFCGLAVQDREQNRLSCKQSEGLEYLSGREIKDRRSFVTSLTRLGLKEENDIDIGGSGHLFSFLGDGVRLTLRGRAATQSRVWRAPGSLFEGL
jgi:hypothetical protein